MYIIYILQSEKDNSYYVGHTSNLENRLSRHNSGREKYTKKKVPWRLVYQKEFKTKGEAMRYELKIKSMKSSKFIVELIG